MEPLQAKKDGAPDTGPNSGRVTFCNWRLTKTDDFPGSDLWSDEHYWAPCESKMEVPSAWKPAAAEGHLAGGAEAPGAGASVPVRKCTSWCR